ncbi:TPA: restriction endonuclease subunit S [Pasteurella multocida]|uniref:restriction endonuclease subunit S n=3 Tax=Pasteurella multocida TaxID=747 RepID=UPI0028DFAAEF|nr:restriction endonuclease subunit S [Pasteurella multocida]MDT8767098.1 restriction endonuclease subunit S [Pasteurella multocida]HDR0620034.1 restriction endonuclease subunit S [Pasteurella multocida]
MNNKKSSVPKLRFPEFTDAWEQRKLGNVVEIIMGQSPSSEYYTDNPEDYILVQGNADIKNGKVFPRVWTTQITKMSKKNDLIMSVRAPVGDMAKTDYEVVLGRGVCAIRGDEFIYQLLNKMKIDGYWQTLSTGSTFESINSSDIKNAQIVISSQQEQQKIGSFFTALDRLITTHQRKLENVKKLKKSLLQKMFPKSGQEFPEIRFPEFTDAWEQRKLGKLADFNPRSNLPDEFKYVDLESVVGTELTGYRFENKLSAPSRAQRLAQKGDIFYQTVRPYQKNNYLFEFEDENFVFSTGYAQLRPLINGRFLFSKLQEDRFVQQVLDKCTGTSYPAINSSDLSEIKVYIPDNKQEQQKIGSFFTALDRLITTHQRKLENVKNLKKALLQQMFV